jgi:hypothetical protein
MSYEATIKHNDLNYGVASSARIYPVIADNKIKYVVVYNKENKKN